MSSWLSGSLAKAEQLLEKVDKSAGEKIEKVKERAGIQQRSGSGSELDETGDVQLSAAAVALLEKTRGRAQSTSEGAAADERAPADGADADGAVGPEAQQRRARVAEWE
eukprot:2000904-Prymnesium_polylepis.1